MLKSTINFLFVYSRTTGGRNFIISIFLGLVVRNCCVCDNTTRKQFEDEVLLELYWGLEAIKPNRLSHPEFILNAIIGAQSKCSYNVILVILKYWQCA